ncbi:hypothetical protein BC829DRAFT_5695 [Chytridium lagenaria]|nr:hypothetical protein BC829DRAFT_5695 [Chytridium lagenaria]
MSISITREKKGCIWDIITRIEIKPRTNRGWRIHNKMRNKYKKNNSKPATHPRSTLADYDLCESNGDLSENPPSSSTTSISPNTSPSSTKTLSSFPSTPFLSLTINTATTPQYPNHPPKVATVGRHRYPPTLSAPETPPLSPHHNTTPHPTQPPRPPKPIPQHPTPTKQTTPTSSLQTSSSMSAVQASQRIGKSIPLSSWMRLIRGGMEGG